MRIELGITLLQFDLEYMLVLGDLACPNSKCANLLISDMQRYDLFRDKIILCNLEGMIRDDEPYFNEKLFNHSKVLDAFESTKTVFSIANNHTYDYPEQIENTEILLKQRGFYCNGVYDRDIVPTIIQDGNSTFAIFHIVGEYIPKKIPIMRIELE